MTFGWKFITGKWDDRTIDRARNYSVLYAYKARQRLNRLFMISKFIFCVSFFLFYTIRCDMRIILFLRNLFFLLFINQFEIVVIVSR